MKKYKILVPILSILTVASFVFLVFSIKHGKNTVKTVEPFTIANSKYSAMLLKTGAINYPLLATDFDNIFYMADPSGNIAYYEYSSEGLVPYKGKVSTLSLEVTCSNQDIPVKLSYIQQGNKITGFGLFTTGISKASVKIYDYAFFKMTALPACYGDSGALLLIDFDKNKFYQNNKLYTEALILNIHSGDTERLVTNNSRTIDSVGAFRSDWVMLNDDFLKSLRSNPLFLSSRDYTLDQKGSIADILTVASLRPPRVVKGILGLWARVAEKRIYFLRSTVNGFKSVVLLDKKESTVKEFSGDYFKDYLCSGNYVFNIKSMVLSNLITGEEKVLKNAVVNSSSVLSVSPDGTKAVIATAESTAGGAQVKQTLGLYDLKSGLSRSVAEPLIFLKNKANFCWIDNNTLLHLRPKNDDGTGLSYCVLKFSDTMQNK